MHRCGWGTQTKLSIILQANLKIWLLYLKMFYKIQNTKVLFAHFVLKMLAEGGLDKDE